MTAWAKVRRSFLNILPLLSLKYTTTKNVLLKYHQHSILLSSYITSINIMSFKREKCHQNCIFKDRFFKKIKKVASRHLKSQSLYLWPKVYLMQVSNVILNTGIKAIKKYKLTQCKTLNIFYYFKPIVYSVGYIFCLILWATNSQSIQAAYTEMNIEMLYLNYGQVIYFLLTWQC